MRIVRYIIIIAIVIATVILVRLFLICSYRITSNDMSNTLKAGDFVLVNKLKNSTNPNHNRMVLYKSPLRRDVANPPLFIGRCIGIPGDVIQVGEDGFRVNGRLIPNAPIMHKTFRINKNIKEHLINTMELLHIPLREVSEDSVNLTLRLSLHEEEILQQNLSQIINIEMISEHSEKYEFTIPGKYKAFNINAISLTICKEAIMNEEGGRAEIRDGKLYVDGKEKTYYFFKHDYYWMLSENETDGIDSRHLGLIPKDHVVGNIFYCWYSKDAARRFKTIK